MKALKNLGFGPKKSKSGFTLIELLIVMVILAILAGVIVMAVGGVFGSAKEAAYNSVSSQMSTASGAYAADNQGTYPLGVSYTSNISDENGATINHTGLFYLDLALMVTSAGGMLQHVPDGCTVVDADNNDNCDQSSDIGGCSADNHYLWVIDSSTGNVYSVCIGTECLNASATEGGVQTNDQDGYMQVWP